MSKILIVEDDTVLVDAYKSLFAKEGLDVISSVTGQEALAKVKNERPDLILLDIMLPGGMNGFDVLEILKRFEDTKNIPVLVMTNLDAEEEVAKKIGAEDYFVKVNTPVDEVVRRVKGRLSKA